MAPSTTSLSVQGSVQGGLQPVSGASVQIYAAGTKGAGTAATKLLTSTVSTDSNGAFKLPTNFKCVNGEDQIYAVATGGNPGGGQNANLAMMTFLGSCSKLSSSTSIYINEVTTIASVYSLSKFMSADSYDISSSSSDASALASAFTTAGTLANLSTGSAVTSNSVYKKLNSLADSLATCVNTSSNSASCKTLFAAATPTDTKKVPTNTIAAVLNIALHPTSNVESIYNLASILPFQPTLTSSPADWKLFGVTDDQPTTVAVADPVITWATPTAITYGTALSAAQLNATSSVAGTFTYSPSTGFVASTGTSTLSATFTPADTTHYATKSTTVKLVVNKATPVITWTNPASITTGTALSVSQLNAASSVSGSFAYTPAVGTVLPEGTSTLIAKFTPLDATNYESTSRSVSISVVQGAKKTPTISWATPAAITYGTALSATQLNATSAVAGTFTYSPSLGAVPAAGTDTLSVTFTPTDTNAYSSTTANVNLVVNKAATRITWAIPTPISYGSKLSASQLNATGSVPGAITYNPAAGATLPAGANTLTATFVPSDTTNYSNATTTVSLQVDKASPDITWATPTAITYGTALSPTQLNAKSSVAGSFVYTPKAETVLSSGPQALSTTFTPTDTSNYLTATKSVTLQVNGGTSMLNWSTPAAITYGTALSPAQLNATAAVAGSFSYSPSAGTVLGAGSHSLSVTFTPNDTTNYSAQTTTVNLTVNKAVPTISWNAPASIAYGTVLDATQLNATADVPGGFLYTPAEGSTLSAGTTTLSVLFTPTDSVNYASTTRTVPINVTGGAVSISWPNPASITYGTALSETQLNAKSSVSGSFSYSPASGAVLTAGTQTLKATFTPSDTTNYATQTVSATLVVNKATPTITWSNPATITAGTALSKTQLNATTSVPGSFSYSPAEGAVLPSGTTTLTTTFTPTDQTNYNTATATVNQVVGAQSPTQVTPVITWATPAAMTYGTALSESQLNASANVAGSFTYSPVAGTVLAAGTRTLTVTFNPSDTAYAAASASVTVVVNKANPKLTWATPASITYGTALSSAQLNATSNVDGTFSYQPASGAMLGTGTQTLSVSFTPSDSSYNSANATVSLTVNKVTPVITWGAPSAITKGTALSETQLNATANVPGAFVYSPALGTVPSEGNVTLSTTFTPTDSTNYSTATASVTLSVTSGGASTVTDIGIGSTVAWSGVKRLGMNIGGQGFYDSSQMLNNLVSRNPGFEGQVWQSIFKCVAVSTTSCTDSNEWSTWPADFAKGGTFEFIYGGAKGMSGTISSSLVAGGNGSGRGVTINFPALSSPPQVGDYVIVRINVPGNAQAGWWPYTGGGATMTTEFSDLPPGTSGKQALRIMSSGSGQGAAVHSYFDSYSGRSFVQLKGQFQVTFKAKGLGGANQLILSLSRNMATGGVQYLNKTVSLSTGWQDYTYTFTANETGNSIGTVQLDIEASGTDMLLDDVSVAAVTSNNTPFRDDVVNTLKELNPGVLRYFDSGNLGSTIDDVIAPAFGRRRAGYSGSTEMDDIALGLHEFMQLAQVLGAEPYFNMPASASPQEMKNLIEYFAGDASTVYGAKRAARGQSAPWTSVFPMIHIELGNEEWNWGTFAGAAINDPTAYGARVGDIFAAAKSSPSYKASSFDLVLGGWADVPTYNQMEIAASSNFDSFSTAPYLFYTLNDTSSKEAIFGPMFAQPELLDSTSAGQMNQNAAIAKSFGTKVVVYEVNLSTLSGTANQSSLTSTVASLGAGLTVTEHMLLMLRDLGITTQSIWSLPGISNSFYNTSTNSNLVTPLFGTVVDMGGETNLKRPTFLAEELANTAIMPNMLTTTVTGANPTWNQTLSANDNIQLTAAHEIQSFAFSDGASSRSLIVFNLSRTTARSITFSGSSVPTGTVAIGQLTSANIDDTNESTSNVSISNTTSSSFNGSTPYSLPPYSMTVFTWKQ